MLLQISLVLVIAANALALPAANQTGPTDQPGSSTLEKRFHHGWIGAFQDENCTSRADPRPEIHLDDCVPFEPRLGEYVGIYFGTGAYKFDALTLFTDGACEDYLELWFKNINDKEYACLSADDFDYPVSVQTYSD